jgi:sigma-E factor negative regulatory protein RseB
MEDPIVARSYFPELPLSAIESKNSGYLLETSGRARIAGHMAIRVSISPQDSYRYGYEFWLEEGTGLLLKWVLLDTNQQALAKLMFTEFKMGTSVNWDELESESRKDDFVEVKTFTPEETVISSSSPRWQPGKLPPGFRLESHSHLRGGNGVFEHSVYTDGLAAVSVYIEKYAGQAGIRPGVSHLGTNNAYAKRQGELQITVIGEVPAITVRSIANEMARAVASR